MLSFILKKRTLLNKLYYKTKIRKIYTYTKRELSRICNCKQIPTLYENNLICLISKNTFSAGEEFVYDLQSLNRAIVIGEYSGGGANGGDYFYIDKNMYIFIPFYTTINVRTKTNWNDKGIIPNIKCKSGNTLKIAMQYIKNM